MKANIINYAQGWLLATLVLFSTSSVFAKPYIPLGGDKKPLPECREVWRKKKFTRFNKDPKLRSLFKPSRGADYFEKENAEYKEFYKRVERDKCYKKVTIFLYMGADNDLSPYSWRDIAEMEQIGSTLDVDLIVFQDDAQQKGIRYYHIAKRDVNFHVWYKQRVLDYAKEIGKEDLFLTAKELPYLKAKGPKLPVSPIIKLYPEGDSGDIRTAGRFLVYAMTRYPSERIALIGWSHGEGFDAPSEDEIDDTDPMVAAEEGLVTRQGGFSFDYESGSHMRVTEMVNGVPGQGEGGLKGILKKYRGGNSVDWAGSDSCLNQQMEFGLAWNGVVDYLYGSANLLQGKGFNYGTFLRNLNSHTDYYDSQKAYLKDFELLLKKKDPKNLDALEKKLTTQVPKFQEQIKKLNEEIAKLSEGEELEQKKTERNKVRRRLRKAQASIVSLGNYKKRIASLQKIEDKKALKTQYLIDDTRLFARNIPAIYGRSVSSKFQDLRLSHYDERATMAVWDMPKMNDVVLSMNELAQALTHYMLRPKGKRERTIRTFGLSGVFSSTRRFGGVSSDLYHFLMLLEDWVRVKKMKVDPQGYEARTVLPVINDKIRSLKRSLIGDGSIPGAVLASFIGKYYRQKSGGLLPWKSSLGTSFWYPHDPDEFDEMFPKLERYSSLYKDSRDSKKLSAWGRLIQLFYVSGDELAKASAPSLIGG